MSAKTKKKKPANRHNIRSRRKKPTDFQEKDRNYFFGDEIAQLLEEAKKNRHGVRDHMIILMIYGLDSKACGVSGGEMRLLGKEESAVRKR